MARATKQKSEETAARIIESAREMFADRGVAGVGLDEIATHAGVTRGAVYHHFGSKNGVFRAVHIWAQAQVAQAIDRGTSALTDPWQALEAGCRTFLETSVRQDIRRILLIDAPAVLGWDDWRDQDIRNSGRLLSEVLEELVEAGVIDVVSVPACRSLLSGAMNEAALWAASSDDAEVGVEEAWVILRRMLSALRR